MKINFKTPWYKFFKSNSAIQKDFEKKINKLDEVLFKNIVSQSSRIEKQSLLLLQKCIRTYQKEYTYLEIGSHLGGSLQTYYVDENCTRIYSIDKRPDKQPDERGGFYEYENNSSQRMIQNLQTFYPSIDRKKIKVLDDEVTNLTAEAIDARPDLCFIDGEHTNKAVLADFRFCLMVSKSDTTIAFHDSYIIHEGLFQIEDHLVSSGIKFESHCLGGTVYVIFLGEAIRYLDEITPYIQNKEAYFKEAENRLAKEKKEREHLK